MSRLSWSGATFFAVLAAAGASAGGCTAIVGVGDYAVGPSDSGSGSDTSVQGDDGGGADARLLGDSAGFLGDPCVTSSDCTRGTCQGGLWCTQPCTSNSACGDTSQGQPNYCVTGGSGAGKSCVPGCAANADCAPYPGTTCAQIPGGAAFVCTPGTTTADGGGGGAGAIGDPCTTDSQCALPGTCGNATWCSTSCTSKTDTSCGSNTNGQTNYCVQDASNDYICFPGCTSNADCTPFSGTTCQAIVTGGSTFICAGTNGLVGDPCTTSSTSPWASCAAPDGGRGPTCGNDIWCSQPCPGETAAGDASCGTNTAGQQSYCVKSNGSFSCFPGCTQYADCATYPGMFCEQIYGSTRGFVCAGTGGVIGDPCASDSDCKQGTCSGNWCSQPCTSASDTSCGTNSESVVNRCVENQNNKFVCFPGCTVDKDCTSFGGATCQLFTGEPGSVCSF